jgi:hypothetical protein
MTKTVIDKRSVVVPLDFGTSNIPFFNVVFTLEFKGMEFYLFDIVLT